MWGGAWHHYLSNQIKVLCDVNVDLIPRDAPNFIQANIENMPMFKDKEFGVAFCSHTLEHVNNPKKAITELERVAEKVVILCPKWWDLFALFGKNHKWVMVNRKLFLHIPFK